MNDPVACAPAAEAGQAPVDAAALIALVEAALRDARAGEPGLPPVSPASVLDSDLGFDSLGRMELLLRIERRFGIALAADTLQRAETVGDLLQAIGRHSPAPADAAAETAAPATLPDTLLPAGPPRQPTSDLSAATTLLEVLHWHLQAHPDQTQVVCLQDEGEQHISYRQLADQAAAVAAGLQRAGVLPRQAVAIMLPTSPGYFHSYFGILMAGAVPVPIYPPARISQLEDHVLRHTGILANAQAVLLITVPEAMAVARLLQARVPGLRHVLTPQALAQDAARPAPVAVHGQDIAFIQYTSGSTGQPKGVALTHANLLANIRAMAGAIAAGPRDVFVSWLPLYHDMGLIGAWLAPLYVGFPLVVMSPLDFLARPQRWLQAVQRWRGTLSAGPNFAYELCLKRIDDAALPGLDLSSWRLAFNGAEAVSPDTVRNFSARFATCGLRPEVMTPVYGLAEASVGLLFPPPGRVAPIDCVQRAAFSRDRRALPAADDDADALRFVACGRPLPGHQVRLLDEAGVEVGDRVEGRLEFRGPSATLGYFRNPTLSAELLHDGWVDSGDRAYRADGDYYLTGRVKDIIIRGGRNLYPQEIEQAVGQVDGVRKGCVAVFGSADPATGTERLVVLAEARSAAPAARAALHEAVSRAVVAAIGEPADRIVLAPPHSVLKTSSGKLRRSACRALYESGSLGAAPPGLHRQLLRLALGAVRLRGAQLAGGIGQLLYALWALALFALLAPLAWLSVVLAPDAIAAWALARRAACALLRFSGTPLRVEGLDRLPAGPCVLVANHASYLDGLVLVAALPRPFAFVAKRELQQQAVAGPFLRRLGARFVERFDRQRSVEDAGRIADLAAQGQALAVFPEGTFVDAPGLLPFHLGAFLAAARAGVPVVPVAVRGTRELLPASRWWPRRVALKVTVCAPLLPAAAAVASDAPELFATAARLRESARSAISRQGVL